ncbi:MAG: glycosyl hydrolase [Acidobacteriota bacterium]
MQGTPRIPAVILLATALALASFGAGATPAQQLDEGLYQQLRWRHIGPPGNRAIAAIGEPGNPDITYVGAASGGIWRTTNGFTWEPVFDDQDVSSVSSLAVAPSAPNQVWAGTGEIFYIRAFTSMGNGIYKSTDRGDSWRQMGLEKTGRIGRIVVHPEDPDVVYACALGDAYNPQQERGVFRTKDGGASWQRVLFVDEKTGCSDLNIDANDPDTLFAGMWQVQIRTWKLGSGGPGSGIFVTHDGGDTWERARGGLPAHPVGKTSVDVAASDSNRVYALIEDVDPGFYRSDDGGRSWRLMQQDHDMLERPGYYTRIRVAPDDEDRVYFVSVRFTVTRDGGYTLDKNIRRAGGDNHDMWIDPLLPRRLLVANDGGLSQSLDNGRSWKRVNLPIAQLYHVAVDTQVPYYVYANRQDGPSFRAPSNTRRGGFFGGAGITEGDWRNFGGCESGHGVPDAVTNKYAWSGCYDGGLELVNFDTMQVRDVEVWPESAIGWPPSDVKERWNWTFPIHISPHDNNKVYIGSQRVHVTTNHGQSFEVISPDLTKNDKSHQQSSGGITTDNLMTFDGGTLYAIAESPVREGVIWTGSNDGTVQVTRDGGGNWTNVTANIPGMPEWATVWNIKPSRYDAATAYISVDDHLQGNFDPYIFKTRDYGESWKLISAGIPKSVLSNVHNVEEDPVRRGMLYAGTENAVYFSLDDGASWLPLQTNLPHAPAYWLVVQEQFSDLVVATYGRGIWIMDDITPLRTLDSVVAAGRVHLFAPRAAYRFQNVVGRASAPNSTLRGQNPPYGASINYWLPSPPEGEVRLEIRDGNGELVRTLRGSKQAGLNRIWWDLRHEGRKDPVLRTSPPGKSWVKVPAAGRSPITWGSGFRAGPKAVPGTYTVKLIVGDEEGSQQLTVLKDPHSEGTLADIQAQVGLSLRMQKEFNGLATMVDKLEWIRKQLEDLTHSLKGSPAAAAVSARAEEMSEKSMDVENHLLDIHLTGGREDSFRNSMRLYGRYIELMRELDGTSDYRPTDQQEQVAALLQQRLEQTRALFNQLMKSDLARLNEFLRQQNVSVTIR